MSNYRLVLKNRRFDTCELYKISRNDKAFIGHVVVVIVRFHRPGTPDSPPSAVLLVRLIRNFPNFEVLCDVAIVRGSSPQFKIRHVHLFRLQYLVDQTADLQRTRQYFTPFFTLICCGFLFGVFSSAHGAWSEVDSGTEGSFDRLLEASFDYSHGVASTGTVEQH